MIPILYESTEKDFISNGLGRLRDCISCVVTEERNGIYECDFEYPIDGVNYNRIQLGRIIGVEHDESSDIQPFDIVGYSRPINGIVTFHCTHISYRQCAMTVSGTNKQSLADAFTWLGTATPTNPFTYWTDKTSTGFLASADGIPHSVRQVLGGMEGSILDAYGGEYEWDTWTVKLWASRGEVKPFSIRYGVNLTDYSEEVDYSDTYTSVIPYWSGQDTNGNDVVVKGSKQTASYPSFNGMDRCIPLDVTDKFENKPTVAQVESAGLSYINSNQTYMPSQNITVDFVRLSESAEYAQFKSLQSCKLCDSINVYFPMYNMGGQFKIVKTEYDVLQERYSKLELGTLSTSLAEALGINQESADRLRSGSSEPSSTTPKMDGTASAGSEDKWSRGDHVHPTDTTRQAALGITTVARGWLDALTTPASSYKDFSVSFGKTFASNPYVVVSFASASTAAAFGRVSCAVHTITTSGCKVRVFNSDTTQRAPAIYWIAIR